MIIPFALQFLLGFAREGVEPLLTIDEYIGFVTTLMLVFGLMLQFPVVIYVLARLGIVTPKWLASQRRWAILLIAVVSALATPGGDPFSMVVLACSCTACSRRRWSSFGPCSAGTVNPLRSHPRCRQMTGPPVTGPR